MNQFDEFNLIKLKGQNLIHTTEIAKENCENCPFKQGDYCIECYVTALQNRLYTLKNLLTEEEYNLLKTYNFSKKQVHIA